MDRTSIIKSLAEEMNVVDPFNTRTSGVARYDSATGTLYCDGVTLPHSTLEQIKKWYYDQMIMYRGLADKDTTKMDLYMRYVVAYNAINMMEDSVGDMQYQHSKRTHQVTGDDSNES